LRVLGEASDSCPSAASLYLSCPLQTFSIPQNKNDPERKKILNVKNITNGLRETHYCSRKFREGNKCNEVGSLGIKLILTNSRNFLNKPL
jgi:hypothetical protein